MSATRAGTDRKFRLEVEPDRDAVSVCPSGELDLAVAGRVREKFDELTGRGFRRIALDLRGLTFLDSSGLRLALDLSESARADGWEFAVVEGPPEVQRVFELTGVRPLIRFIDATEIRHPRWSRP